MDHFTAVNLYTAVYKKDGDWWVGYVEELPGAHTQGTLVRKMCRDLGFPAP